MGAGGGRRKELGEDVREVRGCWRGYAPGWQEQVLGQEQMLDQEQVEWQPPPGLYWRKPQLWPSLSVAPAGLL